MKLTDKYDGKFILQDYVKRRKDYTIINMHEVVPSLGAVNTRFFATKGQVVKIIQQLMRLFYIKAEDLEVKEERMVCERFGPAGCEMSVASCLLRQENAKKYGCQNCEQGKEVAKGVKYG